ncbi:unnamed protein product [Brassicogethes aeneus]|uniref:Uncharacterized protein n=1 Tax=Brassicogethes aeneus TaxID=1431903 RepID=A0A9P0B1Z1_BRAAE|nr:unnamed protein product [Brassicogethes aeneus]
MEEKTSEEYKELGNTAVRANNFAEAVLHYTCAIKTDETNYTLYSNRSLAFLKVQQYYHALEDANATIRLNPIWPKGHFRKGEVEFACSHFMDAYESYKKALELKPDDVNVMEALNKAARSVAKERKADETIPWLGAGIGIILGVIIVIADCLFTFKPTHPMLMAFITIIISMIGYCIARFYRYWIKTQRSSLLSPPIDLLGEENENSEENPEHRTYSPRYSKSQARQRYRKGKL